jgi:hypothetical protein
LKKPSRVLYNGKEVTEEEERTEVATCIGKHSERNTTECLLVGEEK